MSARHHYIPQFYLEGFVDPASKKSSARSLEPYLWVSDLEKLTIKKRAPKKAAQYTGYYDLEGTEIEDKSILEKHLSAIEGLAAPIIRKLGNQQFKITTEERFHFSNFVGLQLGRVPATRRAVDATLKKRAQEMLREYAMDDDKLQGKLGEKEDIFKDLVLSGQLLPSPGKDLVIASALRLGLEMAEIIFAMNWSFILAPSGSAFFTSDNPVGLLTPDAKSVKIRRGELNQRLEISFPLVPSCALLAHMYLEIPDLDVISVKVDEVIEMNRRVFPTVQRCVYCSTEEQSKWVLTQNKKRTVDELQSHQAKTAQ